MITKYLKRFCEKACAIKLIHLLAFIVLLSAQALMLLGAFWLLYPFNPSDVLEFKPMAPTVKRGQPLAFKKTIEKYIPASAHILRYIKCDDGNLVTLTDENRNLPLGITTVIDEMVIPTKVSLGKCYLSYTTSIQVNPLRTITEIHNSEPFVVTN